MCRSSPLKICKFLQFVYLGKHNHSLFFGDKRTTQRYQVELYCIRDYSTSPLRARQNMRGASEKYVEC